MCIYFLQKRKRHNESAGILLPHQEQKTLEKQISCNSAFSRLYNHDDTISEFPNHSNFLSAFSTFNCCKLNHNRLRFSSRATLSDIVNAMFGSGYYWDRPGELCWHVLRGVEVSSTLVVWLNGSDIFKKAFDISSQELGICLRPSRVAIQTLYSVSLPRPAYRIFVLLLSEWKTTSCSIQAVVYNL